MEQQRWERHVPDPGCGADERSEGAENNSAAKTSRTKRAGEAARVGGKGEVP